MLQSGRRSLTLILQSVDCIETLRQAAATVEGLVDGTVRLVFLRLGYTGAKREMTQIVLEEMVVSAAKNTAIYQVVDNESSCLYNAVCGFCCTWC